MTTIKPRKTKLTCKFYNHRYKIKIISQKKTQKKSSKTNS